MLLSLNYLGNKIKSKLKMEKICLKLSILKKKVLEQLVLLKNKVNKRSL